MNDEMTQLRNSVGKFICDTLGHYECDEQTITRLIVVANRFGPNQVKKWFELSCEKIGMPTVISDKTLFRREIQIMCYFNWIIRNQSGPSGKWHPEGGKE